MSLLASAGTVLAAGSSALVDASGAPTTLGIFASEFFGTFILILLGAGVCAAVTLKKSYAKDAGWGVITFGWGLAVFTAVYLSFHSGAHLNPAVTVGLATAGKDLATGVPATPGNIALYIVAQMLGAMAGATGSAINPARDLGPRIAYTFLPIPGKTGSNWSYAWVPVVGPIIGAILAGLIVPAVLPL